MGLEMNMRYEIREIRNMREDEQLSICALTYLFARGWAGLGSFLGSAAARPMT